MYNLKMVIPFCILCHIRISHYDGFIQGCFKYLIVFALRCWTVSYYDTVSYVFYVFYQDMPLIWACHILCVFYTMSLLAHQVLDRVLSDPAPCIYFFTNSLVVLIIPLYINTTRGTYFTIFISYHVFF